MNYPRHHSFIESESRSVTSDSLRLHGLYRPIPGQNTGVSSLSLLQGIFPTQGLNPGLPHCGQILHQLSQKVSSRILEWVAYPLFRGSSWPRNPTGVSCIAGRFFTNWAIREAHGFINTNEIKKEVPWEKFKISICGNYSLVSINK